MDTWREGFLIQAKQEFAVVQAVIEWRNLNFKTKTKDKKTSSNKEEKTFGASICMLLQMFFEKYSKACWCSWNGDNHPPKKHKTIHDFVTHLKRSDDKDRYNPVCCKIIQQLENLQPSIANKKDDVFPQLEYPWRDINVDLHKKVIRTPATDLELALEIDNIYSRKLNLIMKFALLLINDFDKITSKL
jgi:hypothetical protein